MARKQRCRDDETQLAAELAKICTGLSPIESALLIADGLRIVYGGEWSIEANTDGSFAVLTRPND